VENAYIAGSLRTPFRRSRTLASLRTDDIARFPSGASVGRNAGVDWSVWTMSSMACQFQAGEDNRNVARMAILWRVCYEGSAGHNVNRLLRSSMEAVATAARAINCDEANLASAGGVVEHVAGGPS